MLQFILDTDHLTLFETGHSVLRSRLANLPTGSFGISIVTAQESLRGRLAALSKARTGQERIRHYESLASTLNLLAVIPIAGYTENAEAVFSQLKKLKIRIGTQDLKIAAIALSEKLVLVTRNKGDFGEVPGIVTEDWSR